MTGSWDDMLRDEEARAAAPDAVSSQAGLASIRAGLTALQRRRQLARLDRPALIDAVIAAEDMVTSVPTVQRQTERERIEQSNDVAGIVIDVFGQVWPSTHADLSLRYGIADALWSSGYRRTTEHEVGSRDA